MQMKQEATIQNKKGIKETVFALKDFKLREGKFKIFTGNHQKVITLNFS